MRTTKLVSSEWQIPVKTPYRLDLTVTILKRLSATIVDRFDGTTYRRALEVASGPLLLEVRQASANELRVKATGGVFDRKALDAQLERMLGTNADLSKFRKTAQKIPWLHALVTEATGVKPPTYPSIWESLVNSVVYQQISIFAAGAILRRLIEALSTPLVTIDGYRLFPSPKTILEAEDATLYGAGLSKSKVASLRALATAVIDGRIVDEELAKMPTPELREALVTYKGIGPWTAAVVALRGFGRLDTFPMLDSGVARSLKTAANDENASIDEILEALGEQRGMLYYYFLLHGMFVRGDLEKRGGHLHPKLEVQNKPVAAVRSRRDFLQ